MCSITKYEIELLPALYTTEISFFSFKHNFTENPDKKIQRL